MPTRTVHPAALAVIGACLVLADTSARAGDPAPAPSAAPAAGRGTAAPAGARSGAAPGAELPTFEPGMWEYQRTVTVSGRGMPQNASVRKCSDPGKEIRQKLDDMKQKGCRFERTLHTANHYHSSWTCPVSGGTITMTDVLTVKSADSYEDVIETRYGQRTTRSAVVATRVGTCPALPGSTPAHHPAQPPNPSPNR